MFGKFKNLESNFTVSKAAIIVGFFTLITKIIALFRDPLILSRIGVNDTTDIYFSAFRIPDFIFNLLVLGTLSVAFIPVFTEWLLKDKQKAYRIASSVLNFSLLGMGIICLMLFGFSTPLTKLLVPGFSGIKLARTVNLMRLFLLSPLIFTISNIFSSILTSYKKFLVLSMAPVLYNLGIIGGVLFFYPRFGLIGLGWGVICGALMHMLIQLPEVLRHGFKWRLAFDYQDPELHKIAKLFLPRIIGMDISQISLIIGTTVGSILASGSVTIFTSANNLQAAPLGIFALSVSTASFPLLSELYAKKDDQAFIKTLADNVMLVLYFIIPISVLMYIFRVEIIRIIYLHGRFNSQDAVALISTFSILILSLFGQSLSPLFSRSFYARHNTKIPVLVNLTSIILDAILAYVLGKKFGLIGIAWGFVIACTLDACVMFVALRIKFSQESVSLKVFDSEIFKFLGKLALASVITGFLGLLLLSVIPISLSQSTVIILIKTVVLLVILSAFFLWLSWGLKLQQTNKILKALKISRR